jgi:hypothetical protein
LIAALAGLPPAAVAKDPPKMTDATRETVKRATALIASKRGGHGSGFLVLPDVLATNAHVVGAESIDALEAKFVDDRGQVTAYPVRLLAVDKPRDLALLRVVSDKPLGRTPLGVRADLKAADRPKVFVLGNPGQRGNGMALVNSLTEGVVGRELVMMDDKPFYELTLTAAVELESFAPTPGDAKDPLARLMGAVSAKIKAGPGNSGGPVLDGGGAVVGVLTAGMVDPGTRTPTGRFFAVPGGDLKAVLDGLGKPDGWDERGRTAVARHAANAAVANGYADLLIADEILQLRKALVNPLLDDPVVREAFGKAHRALAKRTAELAKASKLAELSAGNADLRAARKKVYEMTDLYDKIVPVVTDRRVTPTELKRVESHIEACRKGYQKLAKETGWGEDEVRQLAVATLAETGLQVKPATAPSASR